MSYVAKICAQLIFSQTKKGIKILLCMKLNEPGTIYHIIKIQIEKKYKCACRKRKRNTLCLGRTTNDPSVGSNGGLN